MALTYKKGDAVRQVVYVIEGQVEDMVIVDGEVKYMVAFTGQDGESHSRYFSESEIQAAL